MDWKFNPNEMEIMATFNEGNPSAPHFPKYNTPISCKENYRRFLKGEPIAWMPLHNESMYFAPSIIPDVMARGGGGTVQAVPFDASRFGGKDMFGVEWVYVPEVKGSMPKPNCPKVPDLECWEDYITFPNLDDYDWEGSSKLNKEFLEQGLACSYTVHTGLFERLVSFAEMTDALVGLVDEDVQPAIHRLFDKLCDFYDDYFGRIKKWYDVDQLWFHDDWGSSRAPLFSLEICREMLVPYLKRIVDSAHKYGIFFELHSCGKIEQLVPAMIEAGVDAWRGQPLNDKEKLFELYGDKILLGMEPTKLPADTQDMDTLYADVERFVEHYAKTGRVFCTMFNMPPKAREFVYELSRKAICG